MLVPFRERWQVSQNKQTNTQTNWQTIRFCIATSKFMFRQRWIIINIVPDPVQQVLWMISGFVEVFQEKMLAE